MKVNSIQNNSQTFGAKFARTKALDSLRTSLNQSDKDVLERSIYDIEKINDGNELRYYTIADGNVATISMKSIANKNEMPICYDLANNSLKLIRQFADWYKQLTTGTSL